MIYLLGILIRWHGQTVASQFFPACLLAYCRTSFVIIAGGGGLMQSQHASAFPRWAAKCYLCHISCRDAWKSLWLVKPCLFRLCAAATYHVLSLSWYFKWVSMPRAKLYRHHYFYQSVHCISELSMHKWVQYGWNTEQGVAGERELASTTCHRLPFWELAQLGFCLKGVGVVVFWCPAIAKVNFHMYTGQ